jgi:trehalose 6-phosphate phosphatase
VEPKYFFEHNDPKLECGSRGIFLFLDFDGTLVPIQNDPAKCALSPKIKGQLETIALSGKAWIAILSGRTVSDIRSRVIIQDVYYGGNHGLEISGPLINYTHPDALRGKHLIDKVCREIEQEIGNVEGALIEKKKFGFTLHYRMAKKDDKALIQRAFQRVIAEQPDAQTVAVMRGKKVLELAPNIPWDKGKAVSFLLEKQKRDYLPIYVGDDLTDETAFEALCEVGLTVRIGKSKKSFAQYYLKGQWEVSHFLRHINNLIRQKD